MIKLCRYTSHASAAQASSPGYGILEETGIFALDAAEDIIANLHGHRSALSALGERSAHQLISLDSVRLLAPVAPSKIVCVGRNYAEHAAELGNPLPDEPLLFLKPPSAVIAHEDPIKLPAASTRVEHEGELGVVIGRQAQRLSDDDDPLSYVLGLTCLNDVTARDLQRRDVQFTRGKSFDTFCPVGPFIATNVDPQDLLVETRVNGEIRQSGRTSSMKFSVPYLVRYISHVMTLQPGDLIATGTPAGVGTLLAGDIVEVIIENVGTLRNGVVPQADDRRAAGG